jgi:kinesin family protein 2/24
LEDSFGVTQLAGAVEHRAKLTDDALGLIETATSFRRTQPTQKNAVSSRSHAICRVRIERNTANTDADGLLYLADLAGSEAARDVATTSAEGMKEAREINASLSVLKDCIRNKAESDALDNVALIASKSEKMKMKKPHVPFRQSALTKVLKHVFDPAGARNCKTVVIACVNPSIADVGASRNTLRYAEMLRVLMPKVKDAGYKSDVPMTWKNEHLKQWIDKNVSFGARLPPSFQYSNGI